jgi:hypothetical protein
VSPAGVKLRQSWRAMSFGILLFFYAALTSCVPPAGASSVATAAAEKPGPITIKITNPNIETAIARVLWTDQVDDLDWDILTLQSCFQNEYISVWSPGFYVEEVPCNDNAKNEYTVTLRPLSMDNPNYAWMDAYNSSLPELSCATCHENPASKLNEYGDWKVDGHSSVFVDSYFWNIYTGTNLHGNPEIEDDLGFRLDYPNENGNCAFCHAPAALPLLQRGTDWAPWNGPLPPGRVRVETEGITCDVCHKVKDVKLGADGRPLADQPGVLSFDLARPNSGDYLYLGPWPDHQPEVPDSPGGVKHETACSTIFGEGRFCAACHYGKFYDTVVYNSYGEWLDSNYSKKQINGAENPMYRSCQDCHMLPSEPLAQSSAAQRSACSPENDSFRDFNHNMMKRDNTGAPVLVEGAATVNLAASKEQGKIKVMVTVTNVAAGHNLPTDSPLRHLILVVEARDKNDKLLAQVGGERIPEWGGTGNQTQDYAGKPGVIYANVLKDKVTNIIPAVSYWNLIVPAWDGSDTRLRPFQPVTSEYWFVAPTRGDLKITAQLWYRYAFIDIMRQKGWHRPDKLVNWAELKLSE